MLLEPELDGGDRARDLAGDEGLAAHRAFMVEQDAVRGMHAVGLAIVHRDPIGVELGCGIGRARIEGRRLALRDLLHLAVELGRRCLIEAHALLQAEDADRLQQPERAERVGVGRIFRRLETDLDVALRREIVDLVGLRLLHQADQVGRIGHVAVVQEEARLRLMRIDIEVVDAAGVERRRATLDAVHDIALIEQEPGEIRAILAGYTGN